MLEQNWIPKMMKYEIFRELEEARADAPVWYGPLSRNLASKELSEIINDLLLEKSAKFNYSSTEGLTVNINGRKHNISLLLKTADFSQLSIDENNIKKYEQILRKHSDIFGFALPSLPHTWSNFPREEDFRKRDRKYTEAKLTDDERKKRDTLSPEEEEQFLTEKDNLSNLSYGEMLAINIYTGSAYKRINKFLRGIRQNVSDDEATELLLLCCLAASGLNKTKKQISIPDPSVTRAESNLPAKILQQRIKAVYDNQQAVYNRQGNEAEVLKKIVDEEEKSKGVVQQTGFVSTAANNAESFSGCGFFEGTVYTKFDSSSITGKYVDPISKNPGERELLAIPQAQIQWLAVIKRKGIFYFLGKFVNTPKNTNDSLIIEKHDLLVKYLTEIKETLSKIKPEGDENDKKLIELKIERLIKKTNELEKELTDANASDLLDTSPNSSLLYRLLLLKNTVSLLDNKSAIQNSIRSNLHVMQQSIKKYLTSRNYLKRVFGHGELLNNKQIILMEVSQEIEDILKGKIISSADLQKLFAKIAQAISDNRKYAAEAGVSSGGKTEETLQRCLQLLNKITTTDPNDISTKIYIAAPINIYIKDSMSDMKKLINQYFFKTMFFGNSELKKKKHAILINVITKINTIINKPEIFQKDIEELKLSITTAKEANTNAATAAGKSSAGETEKILTTCSKLLEKIEAITPKDALKSSSGYKMS
jgi:hypothetical protein